MLPQSRGLRLALVLLMSVGYVSWHGHTHSAYAKGGGDDDDDDGGGGGGDDDDDGGGGGKGGGDDDDDGNDDDKDQPPVTAGGLFTLKTYPVRELLRPLTITQKIGQIRFGLGTDLSAKGAFGSFGLSGEGIYGISDNFSIIGGVTDAYNFKQFGVYAGFEGAIAYDLVNIRVAANLHRSAIPEFCGTASTPPANCNNPTTGELQAELPDGKYSAGGTKFSIDLGFPFRYAIKPEIAIIALQTLMSIDFNGVSKDHVLIETDETTMKPKPRVVANGGKPDLLPSIGIATNPVSALSVVIFAQMRIPDFDTSAGAFQVPVTARIEFSPSQKLDLGLEFTLLNVKPPEGQSPIDNRFLSLFFQTRVGK